VPGDGFQLKSKQIPQHMLRHYQGVVVTDLPFYPLFSRHVTTGCHT